MARINVSVPAEMKGRMDAMSDRVNWSEVARSAFQHEIAAATMSDDPETKSVIERLRESKAVFDREVVRRARENGRRWAKAVAQYRELRAISQLTLVRSVPGMEYFRQVDRALAVPSWQDSPWLDGTAGLRSDEYVEAWVEGAKDVWREVADKI